jgi:hypothetical protein
MFQCVSVNFPEIFGIIFALKQIQKKKENLSYRAEPKGPTRSNSAQPPGLPEPI